MSRSGRSLQSIPYQSLREKLSGGAPAFLMHHIPHGPLLSRSLFTQDAVTRLSIVVIHQERNNTLYNYRDRYDDVHSQSQGT
jgi:hypothetical protein